MYDIIERAERLSDELPATDAGIVKIAVESYREAERLSARSGKVKDAQAFRKAEQNLKKLIAMYSEDSAPDTIRTKRDVHAYLVARGYKVSDRTVYDHISNDKLTEQDSGGFLRSDVDKYAETYLRKRAEKSSEQIRIDADTELKRERTRREKMNNDLLAGNLISREKVGEEFAARIVELTQAHENLIENLPHQISGRTEPEIRDILSAAFRKIMLSYSRKLESVRNVG